MISGRWSDESERALTKKISNYALEFSKAFRLRTGGCVKFDMCKGQQSQKIIFSKNVPYLKQIINVLFDKHWTESNWVLNDAQAGFRKGGSIIDHMFTLYPAFQKHLLKNTKLCVAFIDFKKEYGIVNRDISCMVLFRYGVRGQMFKILGEFTP